MSAEKDFAGFVWRECKVDNIPDDVVKSAVVGGNDSDGCPIYIGKSNYNNDVIPAKVMPTKKAAYIAYSGKEHLVPEVEILCERKFKWVSWQKGDQVPKNAVIGGKTSNEDLYIGRAEHNGALTIGKLHHSHNTIYIPYGGKEHPMNKGEVLVFE
nr:uncharacterized protein LOC111428191 [Onthophagus taurus]